MSKTISYTQHTHDVVREADVPLTFDEIMARVHRRRPITTKNPRNTIRSAIGQSKLLVNTGDGHYGWKPRVINGARLRWTLTDNMLENRALICDWAVHLALWPTFFAAQKRRDRSPVRVALPDGTDITLELTMFRPGIWGSRGSEALWTWLAACDAAPGDSLLLEVVDGEASRYALAFETAAGSDAAALARRDESLRDAVERLERSKRGATPGYVANELLIAGFYHHPTPPSSLAEFLGRDDAAEDISLPADLDLDALQAQVLEMVQSEEGFTLSQLETLLMDAFYGENALEKAIQRSRGLSARHDPQQVIQQPPLPAPAAGESFTTYTFRVVHRQHRHVWRDVALRADHYLADLHGIIQEAYGWWDDHLYAFFLNARPWDERSEIGSPRSDTAVAANQVQLGQLDLEVKRRLLYIFDFGDDHRFEVTVRTIATDTEPDGYPQVVAQKGTAPTQY